MKNSGQAKTHYGSMTALEKLLAVFHFIKTPTPFCKGCMSHFIEYDEWRQYGSSEIQMNYKKKKNEKTVYDAVISAG